MNFRDDWPLMAVFALLFGILGFLIYSDFSARAEYRRQAEICTTVGGVPIKGGAEFFCVEKFADMTPAPPHIFCADDSRKPWEEVE